MGNLKLIPVEGDELSILSGGRKIGKARWEWQETEKNFLVSKIFLERENRTAQNLRLVVLNLAEMASKKFDAASMELRYVCKESLPPEQDDNYKMARLLFDSEPERQEYFRVFRVNTNPTVRQNHERLYTEARLAREGFTFLKLSDCDEATRQKILDLKKDGDKISHWIPFDFPNRDENLTLIGFLHDEVCGWMIFEKLSEDESKCLYWYTLEKFRKNSAGLKLAGHFFRNVGEYGRHVQFVVYPNNEPVLKFHYKFFKGAIERVDVYYKLRIPLK